MILVPEIKTVFILTPRTGSGTLKAAIKLRYPKAIALYRHMEADGVPQGYDNWQKVGVVRHPVARMWSLYKFLKNFDGHYAAAYIRSMRASVKTPFCEWIVSNQTVFTSPYDTYSNNNFYPEYTVRHALPETRKSQHMYLRPDLGTRVFTYPELHRLAKEFDVNLDPAMSMKNKTENVPMPITDIIPGAWDHMYRFMAWDFDQFGASMEQVRLAI